MMMSQEFSLLKALEKQPHISESSVNLFEYFRTLLYFMRVSVLRQWYLRFAICFFLLFTHVLCFLDSPWQNDSKKYSGEILSPPKFLVLNLDSLTCFDFLQKLYVGNLYLYRPSAALAGKLKMILALVK